VHVPLKFLQLNYTLCTSSIQLNDDVNHNYHDATAMTSHILHGAPPRNNQRIFCSVGGVLCLYCDATQMDTNTSNTMHSMVVSAYDITLSDDKGMVQDLHLRNQDFFSIWMLTQLETSETTSKDITKSI